MGAFRQDDDEARLNAHLARRLRHAAVEMKAQAAASRLRLLDLEQRYDPNQPRVPAGNPDGGQWTSTGGGGASGRSGSRGNSSRRSAGDRAAARALADAFSSSAPTWRTVATDRLPGGRTRHTHLGQDGTRITEERWGNGTGRRERSQYRVASADGSLFVFDNRGNDQRIFDGNGNLIAETEWSEFGPREKAGTQLAAAPAAVIGAPAAGAAAQATYQALMRALGAAGTALYGLMGRGDAALQPFAAYRIREYTRETKDAELIYVGNISQADIKDVCKAYQPVRGELNNAVKDLSPGFSGSPQDFGIAVHKLVETRINAKYPDHIVAEAIITAEGSIKRHRVKGSTVLDVYEDLKGERTVCIYDHKTGNARLTPKRINFITSRAKLYFKDALRFLVIEVKPDL